MGSLGRHRRARHRGLAAEQIPGQPPKPVPTEQSDEPTRITVDVTRVGMQFAVLDKKGRFVTDLKKDDFEIIENKRPQVIQEFTAETDLPLRLAVLIDTSNSIRDRFKFEQEAASEFLKTTVKANLDKAMVVSFDTSPELVSDLIDETEKLERPFAVCGPAAAPPCTMQSISPAATS